jgi:hypothetical protein
MAVLAVERRAPGDADEIFRLYQDVFGAGLTEASQSAGAGSTWTTPATGPEGPEIWVAREDGPGPRPVRVDAGPAVVGRPEVRSSWGMDVFLRRRPAGRGLGERLFTAWSDHVDVALGWGSRPRPTASSRSSATATWARCPSSRRSWIPGGGSRRLGGTLGAAAGRSWAWPGRRCIPRPAAAAGRRGPDGYRLRRGYDTLWERARGSYAMCVRRDAAYLEWKYARCPHRRYALREAGGRGSCWGSP